MRLSRLIVALFALGVTIYFLAPARPSPLAESTPLSNIDYADAGNASFELPRVSEKQLDLLPTAEPRNADLLTVASAPQDGAGPVELRLKAGQAGYDGIIEEFAEDRYQGKKSFKVLTVLLQEGRTYQFEHISQIFYAYLYLEGPDGEIVAKHNSGGKGLVARIIHRAEMTGSYRIIATSQDGHKTGAFLLSIRTVPTYGGIVPTSLPQWFKDLDKDEDGQVSLHEWLKGRKKHDEFRVIDFNDDGLITAEEAIRHAKKPIELKIEHDEAKFVSALEETDEPYDGKKLSKTLLVKLEKGGTYQFDYMSKAFDAYLYLESPDGEILAKDDDGGEGLNSRIVHRAEKAGIYRLVATCLGNRPGAFFFAIRVLSRSLGNSTKGLPGWFNLLDKDQDGQIAFHEWRAGGKKLLEFRELDRDDDGFITPDDLLRQGPIELKIHDNQANYTGTLEATEEKYRGKKSFAIISLKLHAGRTYHITHQSKVFQAFLYLEDADGNLLEEHSSSTIGGISRLEFRARISGTYRLIATSLGGFRTGDYAISIRVSNHYVVTMPKEIPTWFKDLDKDGDGQVALFEWRAAGKDLDQFLDYDLNDDGFITVEEILRNLKEAIKLSKNSSKK